MSAAWNISRYPLYAYNIALMSIDAGDVRHAKILLQTYLAKYQKVQNTPYLMLLNDQITHDMLEDYAKSARSRLTAIESGAP